MTTSTEVIRRKYAKHLIEFSGATSHIECDVALFALMTALEDLEEVWQDEYACRERRVAVATETASEYGRELQTLRDRFAQMVMEAEQQRLRADALEAEIIRLKAQIETLEYTVEGLRQALATQIAQVRLGNMAPLHPEDRRELLEYFQEVRDSPHPAGGREKEEEDAVVVLERIWEELKRLEENIAYVEKANSDLATKVEG